MVSLWCGQAGKGGGGREGGGRTVTRLPKFLGWIGSQIFLFSSYGAAFKSALHKNKMQIVTLVQ